AGYRCEYSHAPEAAFNIRFEVEHIEPRASGGSSDLANYALGCRSCNLYKSDRSVADDALTGEQSPLFHPRHHNWTEHFEVGKDAALRGLSSVGRATIALLGMRTALIHPSPHRVPLLPVLKRKGPES